MLRSGDPPSYLARMADPQDRADSRLRENPRAPEQTTVDELLAYRAVLRVFVARRIGGADEADDCLQEVYARVIATLPGKKIQNTRAFLFKSASNLIVDRLRSIGAARRARIDVPLEDAADVRDATDPEQLLVVRQQLSRVQRALDQLDPVRRQVFVLTRIEGYSHEEVARKLDIDRYAVARHQERALFHITRMLASEP